MDTIFLWISCTIACVICNYTAHTEQLNDNSPMYIALVLCMFFLLKNISHFLVFMRKPIEFVAPYVIYIYLIHMPIEYELLRAFPQLEQPISFLLLSVYAHYAYRKFCAGLGCAYAAYKTFSKAVFKSCTPKKIVRIRQPILTYW